MSKVALLPLAFLGGAGYVAKKIYDHEKRPLCTGSKSIPAEEKAHPSYEAVVDNYVYVHNAFRNDLTRIIAKCASNTFVQKDLEDWAEILEVHSRFEDEVIIAALQARLKESQQSAKLPAELVDGKDHDIVKELLSKALKCMDNEERITILKKMSAEFEEHLAREEAAMVPLLLRNFTERELWAIDSFIVNPKLDYCDKDTLIKITFWWFGNIRLSEGWPLMKNFIKSGNQKPMPIEEWKKIQDMIPALQKFPTSDLVP